MFRKAKRTEGPLLRSFLNTSWFSRVTGRRTQEVRERSAKPLFTGSSPVVASIFFAIGCPRSVEVVYTLILLIPVEHDVRTKLKLVPRMFVHLPRFILQPMHSVHSEISAIAVSSSLLTVKLPTKLHHCSAVAIIHDVLESLSTKTGNTSLESPIVLAVVGGGPLACNRYGLTGASGFIGRALQRRMLSEGLRPNCFTGDILNPSDVMKLVSSSDVIFHMATRNRGDPIEVFRVGALGTANVVACAVTVGHRHIVFPSSNHIDSHPDSVYSKAKKESERLLRDVAGVKDCRATVFRLPNVYGPGALPFYVSVVATFCYLHAQRYGSEMPIIGDGSQLIELVPVSTVVSELLEAVDQDEHFSLRKIEGKKISVRQLAEIIRHNDPDSFLSGIKECIEFYSHPCPDTQLQTDFASKTVHDSSVSEIVSVCCDYGRACRRIPKGTDYVLLRRGKLIVDFYTAEDMYINSKLLETSASQAVGVPQGYQYAIRAVDRSGGQATIIHDLSNQHRHY